MSRSRSSLFALALLAAALPLAALLAAALPLAALGAPAVPPAVPVPAWVTPEASHETPIGPEELALRWLGTAAFEIRTAKAAILIDPHFSRHSLGQLLAGPLQPDLARIRRDLPPAQAIFIGHAHHDHLIDAPTAAAILHAPLYGSVDVQRVAAAAGLPEAQRHTLTGGERITVGDVTIEVIPSKHSNMITNWLVAGDIAEPVKLPMRFWEYKHGQVFTYALHWGGRTFYHYGSAELVESSLGRRDDADAVLLCMSGWRDNPGVFGRLQAVLHPRLMVPMHHDDFFRDLHAGFHPGQLAFIEPGVAAIRRAMPQAALVNPDLFQELRFKAKGAR